MDLSVDQSSSLFIGKRFSSIEEARNEVLAAAVAEGRSFTPTHSDRTRFIADCRLKAQTGCAFNIRIAFQGQSEQFELRKLVPHTCDFSTHVG